MPVLRQPDANHLGWWQFSDSAAEITAGDMRLHTPGLQLIHNELGFYQVRGPVDQSHADNQATPENEGKSYGSARSVSCSSPKRFT